MHQYEFSGDFPPRRLFAWERLLVALAMATVGPGACVPPTPSGTSGTTTAAASDGVVVSTADETNASGYICNPGEVRCSGQAFLETCAPTGLEWFSEPCGANESCQPCSSTDTCDQARCIGPCEIEASLPSSAGCSFIANRQLHLNVGAPDGLVVTNPNDELEATIQLYQTPEGKRKEEPVGPPRVLGPGEDTLFDLDADFILGISSMFRTGGTYRVQSNVPVVAYQHSPLQTDRGNDSSLLWPETALRADYVVFSFSPHEEQPQGQGQPSYFEIVALEDFTEVEWTPPVDTAGTGLNISFVPAGETSPTLTMNRFDTVRIAASANVEPNADLRDISGTVIHATKPIWVVGASRCSRVPVREMPALGRCDPLQEVLVPLDYWGDRYVGAHSPQRGDARHWWRLYSSQPGVRVTAEGNLGCTDPIITEQNCVAPNTYDDGACILEKRGSWFQLDVPSECSFFLDSNNTGAFMPVQYLQSSRASGEPFMESTEIGDPAMYQMVPVDQFLKQYVFSTGVGFDQHYVQVIREVGGPTVFLAGASVGGFYPVNADYEVADVALPEEGAYVIKSAAPFGIVQFGYTSSDPSPFCDNEMDGNICHASYAYPGGMKSEQIFIP